MLVSSKMEAIVEWHIYTDDNYFRVHCKLSQVQPPISAIVHIAIRQIWGPNVNNNIYILTHECSSTGFE